MTAYIRRTYEPLKFLGRLFWVPMHVDPHTPYASYAPTWEASGERWGPTVILRLPFSYRAIGLGLWLDYEPDSAVPVHVEDAEFDRYCVVNGPVDRVLWASVRAEIAEMGLDPDEEMALMQQKGVMG